MTAQLSATLQQLSDSLKHTSTLITRLSKLQFSGSSEPLDPQTGNPLRLELASDIHETLKDLEDELEYLTEIAEDFRLDASLRQRNKTGSDTGEVQKIEAKVTRLGEQLRHSRQSFRNAQLSAKFKAEEAKRQEREAYYEELRREETSQAAERGEEESRSLLFAGRSQKDKRKGANKDEILVGASSDVTSALRRTHDLLTTELSRSRFAQETFDESTAALAQLGEDYGNLDNLLGKSRDLLGTLLRSQKSDTWYLETAFYVLLTTLCWLLFRRILYGPLFKLPLFFWRVGAFLLNWVVWKPLFAILSVTGIITSGPAATTALSATGGSFSTTSRAPLIVQPSATGRPSAFPEGMDRQGIPVGAGGAGAKKGHDGELQGKMSEEIGKMAEGSSQMTGESGKEGQGEGSAKEGENVVRRGDGTVLKERGEDEPVNPKKKTFDAEPKPEEQGKRVKRDEL